MPRLVALALLALPVWSALAWQLHRAGGYWPTVGVGVALACLLAAWGGARVGTANPVSRTARWDRWFAGAMLLALLALPAVAVTYGIDVAAARHAGGIQAIGAGILAGYLAVPVAFVVAVAIEVVWPH